MASQANVYQGALTNVQMYTDKVSIVTGSNVVTYNVNVANLTTGAITADTIYSNAVNVGSGMVMETYVGVGNFLTIVGGNATVQELGTASSARAGVNGVS
jgi:hypothetical protein